MTNAVTNHSISAQNVVLWQYDKAARFCGVVSVIETWGKKATEALWTYFAERVHGLFALTGTTQQELAAKIDDYSLALWGIFAGVARPSLTVNGTETPMSKTLYRKVLAARLKLLQTNGSLRDLLTYVSEIFGTGKVTVTDGLDMSIAYALTSATALDADAELKALYQLDANRTSEEKYWMFYPAGVRDNAAPSTRFLSFRKQHQLATATTKPNFFSGTVGSVTWKGVFHPKTRSWRFYDDGMKELQETDLRTTVVSTVVAEAATATVTSTVTAESVRVTGVESGSTSGTATASVVAGSTGIFAASVNSVSKVKSLVGGVTGTYSVQYRGIGMTGASWFLGSTQLGIDLSVYGLQVGGEPDVGDAVEVVYSSQQTPPISNVVVSAAAFGTYVDHVSGGYTLNYLGEDEGWVAAGRSTPFTGITYTGTPTVGTLVSVSYTSGAGLTGASVAASVFGEKVGREGGSHTFAYAATTGEWKRNNVAVVLSEYGVEVVGYPNNGDTVTVAYTAPSGITGVTVDRERYAAAVGGQEGSKVFTKTASGWETGTPSAQVSLATYGIEVKGTPVVGNTVTVGYGAEYAMSYANGTWTLTDGSGTATQAGRETTVWRDYGVYFPKGSGTGGTFPEKGVVAVWE